MTNRSSGEEPIEDLVARSSLGSAGARALKRRTSPREAATFRLLTQLRNELVHSHPPQSPPSDPLDDLYDLDEAALTYQQIAAHCLLQLAEIRDRQGQTREAESWRARAKTLF